MPRPPKAPAAAAAHWLFDEGSPRRAWELEGDQWHRGFRIELGKVRRLIEHQQTHLDLPGGPTIALRWQARTGGTFGPLSSAEANRRNRAPGPAPKLDRGASVAWHVAFACPKCDRSCRVLWNPLWHWRELGLPDDRVTPHWQCQGCPASPVPYRWPSQRWTGTSSGPGGRRPPNYWLQRHHHARRRCEELLSTPSRLTTDRWVALNRMKAAHDLLAHLALVQSWPAAWPSLTVRHLPTPEQIARAQAAIEDGKWAMRQTSWHRQGRPRPGPAARAAAAESISAENV